MYGLRVGEVVILPALRETGIALATVLIQIVGFGYLVRKVRQTGCLIGMTWRDFIPRRDYYREILGQSVPSAFSMMVMAMGTFVITYFASRFGTNAVAAYGAAIRIEQIALIPTIGLNVALGTLVGQNNGAGKMDRVRQAYKTSLLFGAVIMFAVLTPVLIFAGWIIARFTDNPEIISIGMSYLYIEALTFYSYVVLHQSNSLLQGLKKPAMILWVSIYRQIPAPLLIFPLFTQVFAMGVNGIWWGLAAVNWSAALFMVAVTLRKLKSTAGAIRPEKAQLLTSKHQ